MYCAGETDFGYQVNSGTAHFDGKALLVLIFALRVSFSTVQTCHALPIVATITFSACLKLHQSGTAMVSWCGVRSWQWVEAIPRLTALCPDMSSPGRLGAWNGERALLAWSRRLP